MLLAAMVILAIVSNTWGQLYPYDQKALAMFRSADVNNDGIFNRPELDLIFKECDSNQDGRVTRHEYTEYLNLHNSDLNKYSHQLYDIYDVDGDHHLDLHDYDNFYSLMDSNSDGLVSREEFVRYWTVLLQNLDGKH